MRGSSCPAVPYEGGGDEVGNEAAASILDDSSQQDKLLKADCGQDCVAKRICVEYGKEMHDGKVDNCCVCGNTASFGKRRCARHEEQGKVKAPSRHLKRMRASPSTMTRQARTRQDEF